MKKSILVFLFISIIPLSLFSQGMNFSIKVYFYPHILNSQDSLRDGPSGKKFNLSEDTFLVWVDLAPGLFFSHKTAYILITREKILLKKGRWWPVLNEKQILYNESGKYALISPFDIPNYSGNGNNIEKIAIHIYPHELTSKDVLTDGPLEKMFIIDDNCLLIWVDLMPDADYAHPTAYILISKKNTRVKHGNWWPTLNGKTIIYGQKNKTGILSPFEVFINKYN